MQDRRSPFVLLVEDHPLVAESLLACIRGCDDTLKVDSAESLAAALRILALRPEPLLIVTDLTLTDAAGSEAVRRLRQAAPLSPIMVFTALDDPVLRSEAQECGVAAYLIKNSSIQTLRDQIRSVIGGQTAKQQATADSSGKSDRLLTPKQRSVLEELVAGRSNKEIATRLNISDETVRSHMKEILGRLGVRNRTEAVVRYLQLLERPREHLKR